MRPPQGAHPARSESRSAASAPASTDASSATEPYYRAVANEIEVFTACHARGLPMMFKGPTGCGKSRFVQYMAWRLQRPLITVACHEDLTASDLVGRFLIRGGETVWTDGPLTRAARTGAICYLDEMVEARQDTVVVIHPLTDDRRILPLDKTGEEIEAAPGFQLIVSYNPGYQHATKDLKPSTRQRFVTMEFTFPSAQVESEIVAHEGGIDRRTADKLVDLAHKVRRLREQGLAEAPGTRLLISTARLIASGIPAAEACQAALVGPLTDDPDLSAAISDLVVANL